VKVSTARTADPYRDLEVIDARAPRFNQAFVGVLSLVALLTGWWWVFGLLALQLIVGLRFGRQFCLPCLFYFEVVQPRIGEGETEDARPPRFANLVGATVLSGATLSHLIGLSGLGWVLGGIVTTLALLAAATGVCVGCELYRLAARLRGIRPGPTTTIDLGELGAEPVGAAIVQFTHPLCSGCQEMTARLLRQGRAVHEVDVSERPDLARKYHVVVVPTAVAVAPDGRVLETIH
jgi:Domain of unknown function (DUF4395)